MLPSLNSRRGGSAFSGDGVVNGSRIIVVVQRDFQICPTAIILKE
jgi:hypothetical protein